MNRSVRTSSRRCGTCASGTGASWAWAAPTLTANPQRRHETINARKIDLDRVIGTVRPNARVNPRASHIRASAQRSHSLDRSSGSTIVR